MTSHFITINGSLWFFLNGRQLRCQIGHQSDDVLMRTEVATIINCQAY